VIKGDGCNCTDIAAPFAQVAAFTTNDKKFYRGAYDFEAVKDHAPNYGAKETARPVDCITSFWYTAVDTQRVFIQRQEVC